MEAAVEQEQEMRNCRTNNEELACCILWSPLPPITWLLPFIGHMGIADSQGVANDFQGPYTVGTEGRMAFGPPTRALKMPVEELSGSTEEWDNALRDANGIYMERMHNICCDNCHSHVACALNRMGMRAYGIQKFDMVKLCFLVFFRASFLSIGGCIAQFLPFSVLVGVICAVTLMA